MIIKEWKWIKCIWVREKIEKKGMEGKSLYLLKKKMEGKSLVCENIFGSFCKKIH